MSVAVRRPRPRAGTDSGYTLIEVLVAVVVLSIGLLGVGKMVLYAARANGSAYMRSEATEQAYAILDYMHANRIAAATGNYDIAIGVTPPAGASCFGGAPCTTPSAIANYDLAQWKTQLAAVLPGGDGSVVTSTDAATQDHMVTVTIQWDDSVASGSFRAAAPATPMKIVLESQL